MPEIKNNFLQGKMNKDLDERLIPNGQYRDALNIEVSTAEDSSVGTVKNVLGNIRVDESMIPSGFKCVGSIANEKNNKLYWFVSSYDVTPENRKDAIIEYDAENKKVTPVVVDLNAGTYKAVLKFSGNLITGINIIDDLLFWTDDDSDPKKINIKDSIKGTLDFSTHTQLTFENGGFNGITLALVTPWSGAELNHEGYFDGTDTKRVGRYAWCEEKQLNALFGVDSFSDDQVFFIKHYRSGEYLGRIEIKANNGPQGTYFRKRAGSAIDDDLLIWHQGDVVFGDDIKTDIEERHVTVIKPKPLNVFSVKINHTQNLESKINIPNIFETKFPRFSYRYKYKDGEYSSFAPFTTPVFNPKYTKDTNKSIDTTIFHNKDTAYDIKDPRNKAMVNSIHSIELTDFITAKTPEDVVEIDVLYKQEDSPIIYSIDKIKHIDPEWHALSNHEGLGLKLGVGKSSSNSGSYMAVGGYTKGKYIVTTENIYAALPANQLLRPWDNVPRTAKAQEVTGNRLVYGNYKQNYNIDTIFEPKVKVSYGQRKNIIASFETQGLPSIKSQRNYQLGIIYCDEFGRETPVFTSNEGAVNVPWQESDGTKNASKSLQLNASIAANFPEWVDSLKFFIKETSSEYYNLTMERAWVKKSTYELDNSEGHLWMSFPSSDRNKISEEDYIILKKKIGAGEEQVNFENKFKVVDIKNEAPDSIKYELVNYGTVPQNGAGDSLTDDLFQNSVERMDSEVDVLKLNHVEWKTYKLSNLGVLGQPSLEQNPDETDSPLLEDLYISWRRLSAGVGVSSKKYKIRAGRKASTNYIMRLSTKITKIDADIAHLNGTSEDGPETLLHPDLVIQIEKKELKDTENFSGKFFVKISKNQITSLIENGQPVSILDQYEISSKASSWYWEDNINVGPSIQASGEPGSNYGLTNFGGFEQDPSGDNSIQATNNNDVGNETADAHALRVTDHARAWAGILNNFGPTFFVDSMHMASGQSIASNYAKYNCILWSGCTQDDDVTKEDSAWSYPPFKTWLTDFQKKTEFLSDPARTVWFTDDSISGTEGSWSNLPFNITWYDGNLISTSTEVPNNSDWEGLPVDGWVGNLQNVTRDHPQVSGVNVNADNHVNGLEGFITTSNIHAIGPRRWFSGTTDNTTEYGVGVDTKTYSDNGETGRHFMHISFFAPGKNLHDGDFSGLVEGKTLYGSNSIAAHLQGIWGGGHFTGVDPSQKFGDGTEKHWHLCMEGNNADDGAFLSEPPAPGVGYGYDINYRELHERQWDPTFCQGGDDDNKIRDFIRNLHAGAQFKFNRDLPAESAEVYTIKKVTIKKLYNHTSWRKPYNRYIAGSGEIGVDYGYIHTDSQHEDYRSVEQVGLEWLSELDDDAMGGTGSYLTNFKNAIENFGKAHNRRVCYIVELDKNPTAGAYYNPIGDEDHMSADQTSNEFANIEFLEPVQSVLLSDLSKFPAIWELDPKKKEVDLDIYYEVSNNIPVKINENTNELIAPIGCTVEVLDSSITSVSRLVEWDGTIATLEPGFARGDINQINEIDYTGMSFKFTKEDGSFIIVQAGQQTLVGENTGNKTLFGFREDIGDSIRTGLSWYNCFSFGNGIESNRIRDDFNEVFITNGVKVSTTTQETYKEERRSHGLIYSGLYNSNSGVNDLNQFIMAEKITKDLNPTYGSIQKLFQRRISLIAFCEDRVLSIISNKDAIYNADGNIQLVATENVLGDVNPFVGDFGISKNPESFASESYRAYFTDKARGAVLRLSKDGLTPISKTGMHDWFRDNLHKHTALIGSYDSYKENYNITLSDAFSENILFDSYLMAGDTPTEESGGITNRVANGNVYSGDYFKFPWEDNDVLTHAKFGWGPVNASLISNVTIINHPFIAKGSLQEEVPLGTTRTYQKETDPGSGKPGTFVHNHEITTYKDNYIPGLQQGQVLQPSTWVSGGYTGPIGNVGSPVPYSPSTYSDNLPTSGGTLTGQFYNADFITVSGKPMFGPNHVHDRDPNIYSNIRRHLDNSDPSTDYSNWGYQAGGAFESGTPYWVDEDNPSAGGGTGGSGNLNAWNYGGPNESENTTHTEANYPVNPYLGDPMWYAMEVSGVITQDSDDGSILFDRVPNPENSWIEIRHIGRDIAAQPNLKGELNSAYNSAANENVKHRSFFNGDELHITFELECYKTLVPTGSTNHSQAHHHGYNFIAPKLEIFDGWQEIGPSKIVVNMNTTNNSADNQSAPNPYQHLWSHLTEQTPYGSGIHSGTSYVQAPTSGGFSGGPEYLSLGGVAGAPAAWANTTTIQWDNTKDIVELTHSGTSTPNKETVTILYGVSFKFRDPTQQDSGGAYTGSADGILAAKVVDDLRIRISQTDNFDFPPPTWSPSPSQSPIPNVLKNPLWKIKNIRATKGFGVTDPGNAYYQPTGPTWVPGHDEPPVYGDPIPASEGGMVIDPLNPTVIDQQYTVPHVIGDEGHPYIEPTYETITYNVYPVPPVPPQDVPAWTEIQHNTSSMFDDWVVVPKNGTVELQAFDTFGNNYDSVAQTGKKRNPGYADDRPPYEDIHYVVPQDWQHLSNPGPEPVGGTPFYHTDNNNQSGPSPFENGVQEYDNYVDISTPAGEDVLFTQNIAHSPWKVGRWYLVDVEYSATHNPDTGTGTNGGGFIEINGVASGAGYLANGSGNIINSDGVGVYGGNSGNAHCRLVPVTRIEYGGAPRTVLRGIFRFEGDSYRSSTPALKNHFKMRFYDCTESVRIQKIITKKLNISNETGGATYWDRIAGNQYVNAPRHAFDKTELYWKGNRLCWEVRQDQISGYQKYKWEQDLGGKTPKVADLGWRLNFKVDNNPNTGDFVGVLRGWVARKDPQSGNGLEGLYFHNIVHKGIYEIRFNMHGDTANVNKIGYTDSSGSPQSGGSWSIHRKSNENANFQPYSNASLFDVGSINGLWWTPAEYGDKIGFFNPNNNTTDMRMGVSNIFLTDESIIFKGGSAGSWNFDGFNTSINNYIYWNVTAGVGGHGGHLGFFDCPAVDPNPTYFGPPKLININQSVESTIPINRYEKYRIEFSYMIDTGKIRIYYFNSEGYGFIVDNISSTEAKTFNQVVTIGDVEWEYDNPIDNTYAPDLKETFVIGLYDDTEVVNGWIDDVRMTRVYDLNEQQETTVTFSEDVNGWTSFKSFVPENGLSLSKKYFTIENGALYQHYVPRVNWAADYIDPITGSVTNFTPEEANNYNTFYGTSYDSSVTVVLNNDPSTVKTFNTLNYEGSQAYLANPEQVRDLGGNIIYSREDLVNINNVKAYTANSDIMGWNCTEIKTDMDTGSVVEFIKKEGKWFNYIKGKTVNYTEAPDTSRFSVQGLGVVTNIVNFTGS